MPDCLNIIGFSRKTLVLLRRERAEVEMLRHRNKRTRLEEPMTSQEFPLPDLTNIFATIPSGVGGHCCQRET